MQESPVRARLRAALLEKLLGKGQARQDPSIHAAALSEVFPCLRPSLSRYPAARPLGALSRAVLGTALRVPVCGRT